MSDEEVVMLPADVDPMPEIGDHPDELTEEEVTAGYATWLDVNDLDDESNGLFEEGDEE